ncbi:HCLS1-associated protein X-1 [Oryzias melastigma]|uniref:HCLS1-associated protein X-1 n=1 Tax=Oryzias melastigma TaxID=30732 RepID=A0A3B3BHH3_ORYME|nr:HCLS1-associated protein X-1 [Oryzias melastigma]KAF6723497.1 HCLS1-associated protein X-1 [Oryzias melastigma]
MSVFDLFRGFFGGHFHGRRDPFFDAMTRDEEDEEEEDDGLHQEGFTGGQLDPFDGAFRFGFSLGPDGMRVQEPPIFGHILREMEEIFSQMGRWESGQLDLPRVTPPPAAPEKGGNPLRDFMLKHPDRDPPAPHAPPHAPFHGWPPLPKEPLRPADEELRVDRDLDSAVSSGGLDQILAPPSDQKPAQPRTRSFFQSVVVSRVVRPDGTVEERRTVRDGHGHEETTVTRSGGPRREEEPEQTAPVLPGGAQHFSDLRDDDSLFSRFFGGFK